MNMPLTWLDEQSLSFPPLEQALDEPPGLIAIGGDLQPQRLLRAYYEGIFPWYEAGGPLLWWSPDPRMVLFPKQIHVSRSLRRKIRRQQWRVSMDADFAAVIANCAALREAREGTWITTEMQQAYCQLHAQGHAHSLELWQGTELIGGLYGVSIGPMFFGESMFSRRSDASKTALFALSQQLKAWHFRFIDCQLPTAHLQQMGARPMPRAKFKALLWRYRDLPGTRGRWHWQLGELTSLLGERDVTAEF